MHNIVLRLDIKKKYIYSCAMGCTCVNDINAIISTTYSVYILYFYIFATYTSIQNKY